MEVLYQAYYIITAKKNSFMKGIDLFALINCLLINYPKDVRDLFIKVIRKSKKDIISFKEFFLIIDSILIFGEVAEEIKELFNYLDRDKKGTIERTVTA